MLELKALLLTQGMHGMVSQVEGLAKALGLSYKHQKIELKSFWNFIPPKISPISKTWSRINLYVTVKSLYLVEEKV